MQCDKINFLKNALRETEKDRVRAIEDMYDFMVSAVPSAATSKLIPSYLKEWIDKRKALRKELQELST